MRLTREQAFATIRIIAERVFMSSRRLQECRSDAYAVERLLAITQPALGDLYRTLLAESREYPSLIVWPETLLFVEADGRGWRVVYQVSAAQSTITLFQHVYTEVGYVRRRRNGQWLSGSGEFVRLRTRQAVQSKECDAENGLALRQGSSGGLFTNRKYCSLGSWYDLGMTGNRFFTDRADANAYIAKWQTPYDRWSIPEAP